MKRFIAILMQKWLMRKIDREIYGDIAPRVRNENTKPYPFTSLLELRHVASQSRAELEAHVDRIETRANGMGEADAAAFRYIMYRDLNSRLAQYEAIMMQRMLPTTCDPKLIAVRA